MDGEALNILRCDACKYVQPLFDSNGWVCGLLCFPKGLKELFSPSSGLTRRALFSSMLMSDVYENLKIELSLETTFYNLDFPLWNCTTKRDRYLALILVAAQFCGWLMQISSTSPERWFLHTNSDILSTNQSHCEVCMVDGLLNRRMMHLTFTGPNFPLNTILALTQDVCMHTPMHLFCMCAHNFCPTLTQAVYLLQGTVTPPSGWGLPQQRGWGEMTIGEK